MTTPLVTVPTLTGAVPIPNSYVNTGGILMIPPSNLFSGVYQFSYILCEVLNMDNCDTANVTVTLTEIPVIQT